MSWYSLFLVFLALLQGTDAYRVVCYYTNWAQYRPGKGQYYPEDVDPHLCTHLMYAFAKPVGTDLQPYEWNDDSTQWSQGMYERTMQLRQFNPNLKIILAVGGYNMASQPFEPIVDNAGSRAAFAQNAIAFLRQRNFDGIDMDWEYPGSRGSPPQDKQKFVLLIQEMERAFKAEAASTGSSRLLITGALPAGKDTIDAGYDIPALSASMDFISVMTYDFHGSWEPYTGINSPLYAHANEVGNARYLNLNQKFVSVGYGHIAPKTDMGRLVTMIYALIGIPLTLLCLTNIGSFFANCFRFLYKHICNGMMWLCCPTPQRRPRQLHGSTSTMTTTASLKSVSSKKSKSVKDMNSEYEESRQALKKDISDISMVEKGLHPGNGSRDSRSSHGHAHSDDIIITPDPPPVKIPLKEEIRVPMVVSLVIIAGYIFGGAVLFSLWEKDWNYLIGSYFCFVTLSTIGFGDYVFGVGSDLANSEKMIICAMYLVLGLSIIAMCFNLMQEEVRAKSRWLGAKLGIIEPRQRGRRKR